MTLIELRHEKTNIVVSDQARHKRGCTATEDSKWLKMSDLESRRIVPLHIAKTKVTAKLICVFFRIYANCLFSHDAAHYYVDILVNRTIAYAKALIVSKKKKKSTQYINRLFSVLFIILMQ